MAKRGAGLARTLAIAGILLGAAFTQGQQAIDGRADYQYNAPLVIQNVPTSGGDNVDELDIAYAYIRSGVLYLTLAGNLDSNGDRLNIFIDCAAGGQNRLRGDNWDGVLGIAGPLARLGNSGLGDGLKFESDFAADYYIGVNRSGGLKVDFCALPDTPNNISSFVGQSDLLTGTLTGGTNPYGIRANYDGSNASGVTAGTLTAYGLGGIVRSGVELAIPMDALGGIGTPVKICAFIGNPSNSQLYNQFLPGVGYTEALNVGSYGDPRAVDLSGTGSNAGMQYFYAPYSLTDNFVLLKTNVASAGATMAAVTLEERKPDYALVRSLTMPTSASGVNKALTMSGSINLSTPEGRLKRSLDGINLVLAGYNAVPGVANVNNTTWVANNRVIGIVDLFGNIDTRTALTDGTGAVSSATSTDGSQIWVGSSTQVRTAPVAATTSTLITSSTNTRPIGLANNQLFQSRTTGGGTCNLEAIGTGLPLSSATVRLIANQSTTRINDFFFADAKTLYIADDQPSGGIRKYRFDGTTWQHQYVINAGLGSGQGARTVVGKFINDTQVMLYTIITDGSIRTVTDTLTATLNPNAAWTILGTSNNSTEIYRGLDWSPFAPPNTSPVLTVPSNATLNEFQSYTSTASAVDPDADQTLTFSKIAGPTGLTVAANGAIAWTPGETDGGQVFTVTVRVKDNGLPSKSDTKSFTITVNEVNESPILTIPASANVDEQTPFAFTATATDSDVPANGLTFSLIGAPPGASINPQTGAFTWIPTESQGPNVYSFQVKVTDDGSPAKSDTKSIVVTVNEVNIAPTAASFAVDSTGPDPVACTLSATDPDIPVQSLSFSVITPPSNGTLTGSAPNLFYTPNANFSGTDTFTYVAQDGVASSNLATVTLNIQQNASIALTIRQLGLLGPVSRVVEITLAGDGTGSHPPITLRRAIAFTASVAGGYAGGLTLTYTDLDLADNGLADNSLPGTPDLTRVYVKDPFFSLGRIQPITRNQLSYSATLDLTLGDLTHNNVVNVSDLAVWAANNGTAMSPDTTLGQSATPRQANLDGQGAVLLADRNLILAAWLQTGDTLTGGNFQGRDDGSQTVDEVARESGLNLKLIRTMDRDRDGRITRDEVLQWKRGGDTH